MLGRCLGMAVEGMGLYRGSRSDQKAAAGRVERGAAGRRETCKARGRGDEEGVERSLARALERRNDADIRRESRVEAKDPGARFEEPRCSRRGDACELRRIVMTENDACVGRARESCEVGKVATLVG